AYAISSSKLRSDEVLAAAGIPVPEHYPKGRFPYIAKPSSMSGSEGVVRLNNPEELEVFLANHSREKVVIEEFLEGPSYSIEVIGTPGNYNVYHITELFMDKDYDCKRVLSCPELPETLKKEFEDIAKKIGEIVKLHGIMDVEVIENKGVLKVLEIDARHPSQTPINIYHATGANFMAEIHRIFCPHSDFPTAATEKASYVSLEQIMVDETAINILGEHIITKATGLHWVKNFCGADEAITNYRPTSKSWVATMICKAPTRRELAAKRENMFREIGKTMGCSLPVADYFPSDN
ncbi:MAG: 3-methylornithine--L-lysine ligase PylC, partial [Bacillota bacterium]|nr:3-methylornithine--L-lysine ligase PylC [Bacillota bacterium]